MIILGSQSKFRKTILEKLGYEFEVMNPDIDEKSIRDSNPAELVLKIARAKSKALQNKIKSNDILISSDLVTVYKKEIRKKPVDYEEARKFLSSYSNSDLSTFTSLVVYNKANNKQVEGVDEVKVYFKEIPEKDIQAIIDKKYILNCGGGFMIEDPILHKHVLKIDGEIKSVMGMPPTLLKKLLKEVGGIMEIHKKTWPELFKEIKSGNKTFEYRLADWQASEGDTLVLEEWDPKTKAYTGQKVTKTIGYVLNLKDMPKFHGKKDQAKIEEFGHMIISLKD